MEYEKFNPITGEVLSGTEEQPQFKEMCLNCAFYDSEKHVCNNEANANAMLSKLKESLNGYEIKNIELAPLPLKKINSKCKNWSFSLDSVIESLTEIYKLPKEA